MEEYITIIGTAVSLVASALLFIIRSVKTNKIKKEMITELNIEKMLLSLIEEAEEFINYSGIEKKTYVITRVKEELLKSKIKFDTNKVSEKIEELINLSNKVNTRNRNSKVLKELGSDSNE